MMSLPFEVMGPTVYEHPVEDLTKVIKRLREELQRDLVDRSGRNLGPAGQPEWRERGRSSRKAPA